MNWKVGLVLLLLASPLARADEPPASSALYRALVKLEGLSDRLATLEKERDAAFRDTPVYREAKDLHDQTLQALEDARRRRDPAAKLQASSDYVRARRQFEAVQGLNRPGPQEDRLVSGIADAKAEVARLQATVATEEKRKKQETAAAARRTEFERAFADAPIVNAKMIRNTGERYVNQVVRLRGWSLGDTVDAYVDYLPGVTMLSDGKRSAVELIEHRRWVGFNSSDASGELLPNLYAHKDTWVDLLNDTRRGTRIDVIGYVIDLERWHEFGVVVLDLKVVPASEGAKTQ